MGESQTEQVLKNLDRRVERIEQFLPSVATKTQLEEAIALLATKVELREAIAEAVAPLATKAELHEAIAAAVAPLATRAELHSAITQLREELREELQEVSVTVRGHMNVIAEGMQDTMRLLAENISGFQEVHGRLDRKFDLRCDGLDQRVTRLEARRPRKT